MDKKTKLIIIILAALTIISSLFAFQINNAKQTLIKKYTKELGELSNTNEQLLQKVGQSEQDKKKIQSRLDSIKKDLSHITSGRDEWKKKYQLVSKEKDGLLEKIAELSDELAKKPVALPKEETRPLVSARPAISEEEGYWANIIREKAALELKLNNLSDDLTQIRLEFENTKKEKKDLELELSKLEQLKDDLARQLEYNEKLADTLSDDLAREVNDKQFLLEQFNGIKQENISLRTQIKELAMTKLALERSLTKLQDEKTTLDKRIFETEQVLQGRIDDILHMKQDLEDARLGKLDFSKTEARAVELPPIIVRAQGETPQVGSVEGLEGRMGRIVSINEENNFVVIDIGENAGVQIRDKFSVYRDSKQIASIEVIQLRKDISAADIIKKYEAIQVGDLVR